MDANTLKTQLTICTLNIIHRFIPNRMCCTTEPKQQNCVTVPIILHLTVYKRT
uniref:Uncharacterized protein n=1 Tax=Anguilla anguilla TaxID=7936 RepID=A0A0E9WLU3_ANGAN